MNKKILLNTYIGDQHRALVELKVSSNDLLSCPLCKKQPTFGESEFEMGRYFYIMCESNEDISGHFISISEPTMRKAVETWNGLAR